MTLTILNHEFVPVVLIDDFSSLIWSDRYNTIGDFELIIPYKEEYNFLLSITKNDKYYLQCSLSAHTMFITKIQISYDPTDDGYHITLSGYSLESILERRVIFPQTILTGSLHNGIKTLITNNIINTYNADIEGPTANRQISNFIFVDSTDQEILAMRNRSQYTGDNLYDTISNLCSMYGIGFKVILKNGNFEFSLYRGDDRSYNQTENAFVLFTPKMENLNSMERLSDYSGYKNAFWAAGEEAAEDRVNIYTVSDEEDPDHVSGLDLREIYVDARDIQNNDDVLSDQEYYDELKKRGGEKLSEHSITSAISGEVQYNTNFEYNVDYFIGDIVQLDDGLGNLKSLRITEQVISYNKEGLSLYPTFTEDNATPTMSSGGTGMITKNEYYTKPEVDDLLAEKVAKTGDTMTGALTMNGADINLKTSGSSSDDSSDIVWYYGNGQEKARLWTENAYTSESGLNFRMYKEDGTQLFSGTIPLRDTNTTYSLSNSGSSVRLTPSTGSAQDVSLSTLINGLEVGTSVPTDNDYYISQYAGGGTTYTTYYRRPVSALYTYIKNKLDGSYVAKAGDTMTGQLKTSFKESVAMGSFQAEAATIPNLLTELRYSSGCCGSFSLGTAYSANSVTIAKGWYNFFYSPHRSGGINGSASQDNCNYGTLLLGGMTVDGFYKIRFSNGSIAHVSQIPDYISDVPMHSIWNSGIGIGLVGNPNDSHSIGIGVSNATTFRSSISAQAALSTAAAALSVTYNSKNATTNSDMWYAKYGNVVQICGSVKNKNAITIPSHGDIVDLEMFTLPSGYRPKITAAGVSDNGYLVSWKITSSGACILTGVYRSTGTITAGNVFYIRATFIV